MFRRLFLLCKDAGSSGILHSCFNPQRFWRSTETMSTLSSPSTPLSTPPVEPYSVVTIEQKDSKKVLDFLRRFFFRDEPLNINVKLLDNPEGTCPELEEFSLKSIKDGLSLMAVSESGNLVGVCLNGVIKKGEDEDDEPCPNPKFDKILQILGTIDKEADVFGKFPDVDSIMNVKILSVDSTWRGRGIAQMLMDRTRDIARHKGFGLMRVDCTSNFSARAIARLGFECVYSLKYSDYKVNNEVVFDPEPPHNEICVYIQKIKTTSNL